MNPPHREVQQRLPLATARLLAATGGADQILHSTGSQIDAAAAGAPDATAISLGHLAHEKAPRAAAVVILARD